jgi:6-phosphogluconolactonase
MLFKVRRSLSAALFGLALMAASTAPVHAGMYVYVGNADSNDIHILQLDLKNGDLTPIDKVVVPGITKPGGSMPLAISPDRRILYAGLRGEPLVAASFMIDPLTGKLTHLHNGKLADSMAYIVTDRTGRFLLGASYGGNKISVNPISPQGFVLPPQQIVATKPNAHSILTDPANRFVLAASLGGDIVVQQRFDAATGMLTPNDPVETGVKAKAGPRHIRFHPNNKYLYLINELDGSVYVFDYDATKGTLKEKQVTTAVPSGHTGKIWAADLQITPDGRFLYGSERGSSTIAGFAVDGEAGTLTPIGSVETEKVPRGFNIDPTGHYLLAVGQESHAMSSYSIDNATGKLTRLKQYPMGKNPNWVEIVSLP